MIFSKSRFVSLKLDYGNRNSFCLKIYTIFRPSCLNVHRYNSLFFPVQLALKSRAMDVAQPIYQAYETILKN